MKILAYISGFDGCGYYRIQLMAKYLNKLPNVHVKVSYEYNMDDIKWADIIVIQKQVNQKIVKYVKQAKEWGKKVVTEVDDDYFNIPTWNPAYKYYHDKAKDLVTFYELSDGMTVTTPHLKNEMLKYNANVAVVPNSIDVTYVSNLKKLEDSEKYKHLKYLNKTQKNVPIAEAQKMMEGKKVIGWGGSPTHLKDLLQVSNALINLCKKRSDLLVVMMGCTSEDILKNISEDQILLVAPSPIFLYPKNLICQEWDVGICPVEDNIFNRSKSNLKFLEFSSVGIPSVCSNVENYVKTITSGVDGLLTENTTESWEESILKIIDDSSLANTLSYNAEKLVKEKFNMSNNYTNWLNFYSSFLK
jgi:glycosyltransferase involved in cell wall biosynthesis